MANEVVGFTRVRIESVDQSPDVSLIKLCSGARNVLIRNTGSYDVEINFNGQAFDDYWTIKPTDAPIHVGIGANTLICARSNDGEGELQIIHWQ